MATAKPHPQPIRSQSPEAWKINVPRPDWFSAATAMATTPSPKQMRTNVPRNSEMSSPGVVIRHAARGRMSPFPATAMLTPFALDDRRSATGALQGQNGHPPDRFHLLLAIAVKPLVSIGGRVVMASQHLSMQFPVRGRRSRASGRGAPVGTLPGPSRTITVEPIQVPVIAPSPPQPAEPARHLAAAAGQYGAPVPRELKPGQLHDRRAASARRGAGGGWVGGRSATGQPGWWPG